MTEAIGRDVSGFVKVNAPAGREYYGLGEEERPLKVLMVNKFHYLRGGSETYHFAVGESLEAMGHEVAWFAMEDPRNLPCEQSRYFVSSADYIGKTSPIKKAKDGLSLIYSIEAKRKFDLLLREVRPDVIHLNLVHRQLTFSILDAPYLKRNRVPVVYTAHDYIPVCPNCIMVDGNGDVCDDCLGGSFTPCVRKRCVKGSAAKSLLAKAEADFLRKSGAYSKIDRIIAPSEFMRSKLLEGGFSGQQVVAMQNFAKDDVLERAGRPDDGRRERTFLYFGRLSREKGVDVAVGAFIAAMDVLPQDWRLLIAGDGPEREVLERLVLESHVEDRVKFLGHLAIDDVLRHAERTSLAIASSRCRENMPYSIIEAFACGTPVIGTRIGGIPELVADGVTGLLCEPDDVGAMADALVRGARLVEDAAGYSAMRQNCRRYILDHCRQDEYMKDLVALYRQLVATEGHHA